MPDITLERQAYIFTSNYLSPTPTINPDPELYTMIANDVENIEAGTMQLDELLCDGDLAFGKLCATKFEVTVFGVEDVSGQVITVMQTQDGVSNYVFTGRVESAKLDRTSLDRQIVAYDKAYELARMNVADWWETFWSRRGTGNATLRQLRESLLDYAGISYSTASLLNDNLSVNKEISISSISFIEMLRMICELSCCFPHFDRQGVLQFYVLDPDQTPADLTDLFEGENSDFEDYITKPFTGVELYNNSSDLMRTVGTSDNPYILQENILLYNRADSELDTIGQTIFNYIQRITFCPSTVKMILSDWNYTLGKKVSTSKGIFYIMSNSMSGSQLIEQTISQVGNEDQEETPLETNYLDLLYNSEISDPETGLITKFEVLDGEINAEISRAINEENYLHSLINMTIDEITAEVMRATTEEGILYSRIRETAEAITAEVSRATSSEDVLRSLITMTAQAISLEVSERQNSEVILRSLITMTADKITSEVMDRTNADSELSSLIEQTANRIALSVVKDGEISSRLSLEDGEINIQGERLIVETENLQIKKNGKLRAKQLVAVEWIAMRNTDESGDTVFLACDDTNTVYIKARKFHDGGTGHLECKNIWCNGNINVYKNVSAYKVSGALYATDLAKVSKTANGYVNPSSGHVGIATGSSRRWKHSITSDISEELDPHKLYDIPIRQFVFNTDYLSDRTDPRYNTPVIGFVAEEVYEAYPIAADEEEDGEISNWNERYLIPPMLALIQEQHKEIEDLKRRLSELETIISKGR